MQFTHIYIVCLFRGSEEFVRCGEFGLTRAQGYSFEQAMQKALDLLKFKENNDLLYMNELKGYYKEEPDYFDEKYQKKILTRIGKGDIVIPESCVGNAVALRTLCFYVCLSLSLRQICSVTSHWSL